MRDLKDYVKLYGSEVSSSSPARSGLTAIMDSYCWVLGVVVEKVSGQSYYDYVRDHIFKPAGMRSTDSFP